MTKELTNKIKGYVFIYVAFATLTAQYLFMKLNYVAVINHIPECIGLLAVTAIVALMSLVFMAYAKHERFNTIMQLGVILWFFSTVYFAIAIALPAL